MARQHKAPQYNVACAECMKIHPSCSIAGLQKEAEERIAKESQNIDHWKSPVCLTPEAQVPLTLESKFRMTPIKS